MQAPFRRLWEAIRMFRLLLFGVNAIRSSNRVTPEKTLAGGYDVSGFHRMDRFSSEP